MKYRRQANENVRRLHISGVQSSISVKLAQLRLRISNPLIKIKEENYKIKLKTVFKLDNITGRHWCISLDVSALIHQRTKSKREYYKLKNTTRTIISTYLEEISKEAARLGKLQEERKLHTLPTTEKARDREIFLQFLRPRQKGSGV